MRLTVAIIEKAFELFGDAGTASPFANNEMFNRKKFSSPKISPAQSRYEEMLSSPPSLLSKPVDIKMTETDRMLLFSLSNSV